MDNIIKIVESVCNDYIDMIATGNRDEKMRLDFFREKYLHFLLYSALTEKGFRVYSEQSSEYKFIRSGTLPQSGKIDCVIMDNDKPLVGFEIFLGYDVDNKRINSNSFKKHLDIDYNKLLNSTMEDVYILNFFYKGKVERSSPGYTKKREKAYEDHFLNCLEICKKKAEHIISSGVKKKFHIWVIEARDDGEESKGIIQLV